MISHHAKEGFDHLLMQAMKSSLVSSPDDHCEVRIIEDTGEIQARKTVILTVSSYLFRAMGLIHFTLDKPLKAHLAAINRAEVGDMDEQAFLDVISECGNVCCGALNRELGRFYPHIGMSTPNVLDGNCLRYLQALDAGYVQHYEIRINDAITMHASLCVCDYADIDFVVDKTESTEDTGELEMF
jgi:CheY-specific phosphatase CheX